jgi:hypothetical protein
MKVSICSAPKFSSFLAVQLAVAVDGKDVTNMIVGEVTKLMASRSNAERRLTVITSAPPSGRDMDEAKVQEHA